MSDQGTYTGAADAGTALSEHNDRDFHIEQNLAVTRTAVTVKVITAPYDNDGNPIPPGSPVAIGWIDVQPMVRMIDGAGNGYDHGTVYRVPYHRPQGGNGAFIADPAVNDVGDLMVRDRDTSVVQSTGAVALPGSRRKFDLADGVYHGRTQGGVPNQWFGWTEHGFHIQDKNNVSLVSNDGTLTVNAPGGMIVNGVTITASGDVITKHGTSLDHHVNTGVTAGGDDSGPPP